MKKAPTNVIGRSLSRLNGFLQNQGNLFWMRWDLCKLFNPLIALRIIPDRFNILRWKDTTYGSRTRILGEVLENFGNVL
jgi:hypothetical protein